jgi:hypothetical protein
MPTARFLGSRKITATQDPRAKVFTVDPEVLEAPKSPMPRMISFIVTV